MRTTGRGGGGNNVGAAAGVPMWQRFLDRSSPKNFLDDDDIDDHLNHSRWGGGGNKRVGDDSFRVNMSRISRSNWYRWTMLVVLFCNLCALAAFHGGGGVNDVLLSQEKACREF
eukprot:jgi/Bigna1/61253/fgenesh1_kg.19_\